MQAERKSRIDPARAAHKAQRRELLLDQVSAAIRDLGAGTSMDDIAGHVGVAKPILYRYFRSRHGLNLALAERFTAALSAELQAALARDTGPRALLRLTMDTYLRVVESEPQLYRWLTQWASAEQPQAVSGLVALFGEEITKVFHQRLEQIGLDTTPAETWAYGIVGMVRFAGDRWLEDPRISREQLVEQLVTLVWDGIAGYAARSTPSE